MSITAFRLLAASTVAVLLILEPKSGAQPALLWRTNYPGAAGSVLFCSVDAVGNILGVSGGGTNIVVVKYSPSGSLIWEYDYAGSRAYSPSYYYGTAMDSTGDLYVAGPAVGGSAMFILKLQANGVPAWTNKISTGSNCMVVALGLDNSGIIHVGGCAYNGSNKDILLSRLNSSGAIIAQTYFDGPQHGPDELLGMTVDPKTGAAYAALSLANTNYEYTYAFAKFDATGALEWISYADKTNTVGRCVLLSADAGIYFTGYSQEFPVLWKFDSSGTLVWKTTCSRPSTSYFGDDSAVVDLFGNVTLTKGDLVFHVDRMGEHRWSAKLENDDRATLAVDRGTVFLRLRTFSGMVLTRFEQDGSQRWSQTTPATAAFYPGGLVVTNGYCVAADTGPGPTGTRDLFVAKYTTNAGGYGPMILSASTGGLGAPGDTIELSVSAHGNGALRYQWFKDNYPLKDATDPYLRFTLSADTSGIYFVTVADSVGTTTSAAMPVTCRSALLSDQTAVLNGTATFTLRVEGETPMAVQWHFNSNTLTNQTSPRLHLTNVTLAAVGTYTVSFHSGTNVISASARLSVTEQVEMEWQRSAGPVTYSLPVAVAADNLGHIAVLSTGANESKDLSLFDTNGSILNSVNNAWWIGSTYGYPSKLVANASGLLTYCAVMGMTTPSIRVAQYGPLATNLIMSQNTYASVWNVGHQLLVDDAGSAYLLESGIGYSWEKPRSEAIRIIKLSATSSTDLFSVQEIAYGVNAFDLTFVSTNDLALVWSHGRTNLITRMRRDGTIIWSRETPFSGTRIVADHMDNLLVIGTAVAKYSLNGHLLWIRSAQQFRVAAAVDQTDSAVVQFSSHTTKFNADGERAWDAPISGSIQIDERNNAYVSGTVLKSDGTSDLFVAKLDTNGVVVWQAIYNGEQDTNEINGGIVVGSDGVVYLCAGDDEARLIKFVERTSVGAPTILPSPPVQFIEPGASATLSATVTGAGLSYQWLLDGMPIPSATNQTLTLTNFQPRTHLINA